MRGSGSLPARACGAIDPCGKATNPPTRRVKEAAGDGSGRRMVLDADEAIEAPLTEVVFDLVDQLPDVGEPEGFRRAGGGLVRPPDAGGNHNGAPLRRERTGAGVRGRRPVRPVLPQRDVSSALNAPGVSSPIWANDFSDLRGLERGEISTQERGV